MRLSIIPVDGAVYKDGICYSALSWQGTPENVHALQWEGVAGWIEFKDGTPNEAIDLIPQWGYNALNAWEIAANPPAPPPPPPPNADQNKQTAMFLLSQTDWSAAQDVGDPTKSNPYLSNQAAFISWRSQVRAIAVYPQDGNLDWPVLPQEEWSSV